MSAEENNDASAKNETDLNADLEAILEADSTNFNAVMESMKGVPSLDVNTDPMMLPNIPGDLNSLGFGMQNMSQPQTKEEIERERMNLLVSHFDEQQMARYAAFRRANIRRAAVKRYASQLLNHQPISNNVAVVLAGMSKVLVGDIVELARDLQEKDLALQRKALNISDPPESQEPEPLLPNYVREAWRIYKQDQGTVPGSKLKPGSGGRLF